MSKFDLRYKGRDDIIHPLCTEWRKTFRVEKAKMA